MEGRVENPDSKNGHHSFDGIVEPWAGAESYDYFELDLDCEDELWVNEK